MAEVVSDIIVSNAIAAATGTSGSDTDKETVGAIQKFGKQFKLFTAGLEGKRRRLQLKIRNNSSKDKLRLEEYWFESGRFWNQVGDSLSREMMRQ